MTHLVLCVDDNVDYAMVIAHAGYVFDTRHRLVGSNVEYV